MAPHFLAKQCSVSTIKLFPKGGWNLKDQVTDGADGGIVKDQGVRQLDPRQLIGEAIAELHGLKTGKTGCEEGILMIVDIVLWWQYV